MMCLNGKIFELIRQSVNATVIFEQLILAQFGKYGMFCTVLLRLCMLVLICNPHKGRP